MFGSGFESRTRFGSASIVARSSVPGKVMPSTLPDCSSKSRPADSVAHRNTSVEWVGWVP